MSSRRWQSFPTAPDGTGLMWSAHQIPQLHFQLSKPDRYFFIQVTTIELQLAVTTATHS
jgi:hypothetical protein